MPEPLKVKQSFEPTTSHPEEPIDAQTALMELMRAKREEAEANLHDKTCPSCGKPVGIDDVLCMGCGLDLRTGTPIQSASREGIAFQGQHQHPPSAEDLRNTEEQRQAGGEKRNKPIWKCESVLLNRIMEILYSVGVIIVVLIIIVAVVCLITWLVCSETIWVRWCFGILILGLAVWGGMVWAARYRLAATLGVIGLGAYLLWSYEFNANKKKPEAAKVEQQRVEPAKPAEAAKGEQAGKTEEDKAARQQRLAQALKPLIEDYARVKAGFSSGISYIDYTRLARQTAADGEVVRATLGEEGESVGMKAMLRPLQTLTSIKTFWDMNLQGKSDPIYFRLRWRPSDSPDVIASLIAYPELKGALVEAEKDAVNTTGLALDTEKAVSVLMTTASEGITKAIQDYGALLQ